MKPLPQAKVKEAIRLMSGGVSTRETARRLVISPSSAKRIYSENKENMTVNKGGRPRKIPSETVEYLKVNLKRGVLKTATEAKNVANEMLPQAVSASTVRRRLKEVGLIAKRRVKRPALKPRHIKGRLQFVKKYKEWTVEDWARVVWSDESKINRICSDGLQWIWDDAPGRITTRSVQGTVKFGGGNVMVWSCMSWYGPGYIAMIDDSMDSQLYIRILKEDLHMSVEEWGMAKDEFVFQHDNDPKHTAKVTRSYLESIHVTETEGTLLYWPAQSPDLNPIEHMWACLEKQLGKYPTRPNSCHELWERISAEWYGIPVAFCRDLIKSMPGRLRAVYHAKGRQTKY
jgi:transposase